MNGGRRREEAWEHLQRTLHQNCTRLVDALGRSIRANQRSAERTLAVLEQPQRWLPRARHWSRRILAHCQRQWAALWPWSERSGG